MVLVLRSLPVLTVKTGPSVPECFLPRCLAHIEASMDMMELNELCDVVEAASETFSSSTGEADTTFFKSLLSSAQSRMSSKAHDVDVLSRFAFALARSTFAPPPNFLTLLVRSSDHHLKAARDGLSSASGTGPSIARLLWGVAQLATNTSRTTSSSACELVDQRWLQDMIIFIKRAISSSR